MVDVPKLPRRLLFFAILFGDLEQTLVAWPSYFLYFFPQLFENPQAINGFLQTATFWLAFLAVVVLIALLVVFYCLGKQVDLKRTYRSVAIRLFVGGGLGGMIAIYIPYLISYLRCALGWAFGCSPSGDVISFGFVSGFTMIVFGFGVLVPAFLSIAVRSRATRRT